MWLLRTNNNCNIVKDHGCGATEAWTYHLLMSKEQNSMNSGRANKRKSKIEYSYFLRSNVLDIENHDHWHLREQSNHKDNVEKRKQNVP